MFRNISLAARILFALLPIAPYACAQALTLKGRVVNEDEAPIGGATIHVKPGDRDAVADPDGTFSIELPAPGDYFLTVQRQGYYQLTDYPVHITASLEITLTLNTVREVFQSVDVSGAPSRVVVDQTSLQQSLNGTDVNNIPYPASQSLRNSMRLMPGVVQDQAGGLHFEGASENQVLYTLNGFDVGDPVTGAFNTRLGVEGVHSVDHSTGRYSPEYGKGSAGVLAIQTDTGTDAFHYTATNFIPGVNTNQGLHFGGWTPRFGFSGPLWKGRAWFADNFDAEYDIQFITGLPKNQDSRSGWGGSNLFHTQFNITPTNILFTDFLVNLSFQSNFGLGALSPVSTTTDQRAREYFYSFKDQIYLGHGALFEIGFAQNRFFNRVIPQGSEFYVISPTGTSGNYFVNSITTSTRDQLPVDGFLPSFSFFGSHQVKMGADADRLTYDADIRRTAYEEVGLAGYVLSRTTFQGSGMFSRPSLELSSYILDTWRLRRNLQIEMGVRQDWDELVRQVAISPRFSIAYAPFRSQHTKLSAGYAITYDPTNLSVYSRPLDQTALTTPLNPDGTPAGPPVPEVFAINNTHLKQPRSQNWSASLDQRLPRRIDGTLNYLRRRGGDGFTYLNSALNPDIYTLTNARRDSYDAVQLIVHQTLPEQFEWMASYTRSHAMSNAVLDLSVNQPLQVANNLGPMPWDAPNRFLGWAYLPLPLKNFAISTLVDARTGYPFSVQDQYGNVVGAVDSRRYPFNFDLNIFVERRFTLRGYRLGLRVGFDNITNSRNPTAVNNVVGSPQYLTFLGNEGRHAQIRIRFFGRVTK